MTKEELTRIEGNDEFQEALDRSNLSSEVKSAIIQKRWDYLWEKYKPTQEQIDYAKEKLKKRK